MLLSAAVLLPVALGATAAGAGDPAAAGQQAGGHHVDGTPSCC